MEFLDPKKQRAHLIRLMIGYVLIAIALILTTVILLYQAYGFGLKNGEVIQNGLIFVSSRPSPADVYINGQKNANVTNTRLLLPAGQYVFELKRSGYRDWKRAVTVEGGSVGRFDYPFLFPNDLVTSMTKKYDANPGLLTESPDRRWLVAQIGSYNTFDMFDMNSATKASGPLKSPTTLTVPTSVFGLTDGTHSWKVIDWSTDNRHVLLQHTTVNNGATDSEYILADIQKPDQSVNLTKILGTNPTRISLRNKKYDQYFLYDQASHRVNVASLSQPTPQPYLDHVLSFKSYGSDIVLYASDQDTTPGKSMIKLYDNGKTYNLRQVSAGSSYMLELTQYSGDWYIVLGAPSENRTYVYKNPENALQAEPNLPLVPVQVLKAANPSYVAFSDNARFIMAEGGQQFAVYDAETDKGYTYTSKLPVDAPQPHAVWMDGDRIAYVSGGHEYVFDFDNANQQTLSAADPTYTPLFDQGYTALYAIAPVAVKDANGQVVNQIELTSTALLTPQDQ